MFIHNINVEFSISNTTNYNIKHSHTCFRDQQWSDDEQWWHILRRRLVSCGTKSSINPLRAEDHICIRI